MKSVCAAKDEDEKKPAPPGENARSVHIERRNIMEEALLETTIVNAILRVGRIVSAGGAAVRPPDRLLNVTEVAKALGIGKNAANELVQNGIIPGIKLNGMKVRQSVLEDWLESMEGMDLSDPKNPVPLAMGGK